MLWWLLMPYIVVRLLAVKHGCGSSSQQSVRDDGDGDDCRDTRESAELGMLVWKIVFPRIMI